MGRRFAVELASIFLVSRLAWTRRKNFMMKKLGDEVYFENEHGI
jgi:hypothetical protein